MTLSNVTKTRQGDTRRSYDDACGTAHALELIGGRWALLVLRELLLGPRRFSELRADLPGISANILTQRLDELESHGLVAKRRLPPPASVQVYEATAWGLEAAPLIREMGRWAARSPLHDPTLPLSGVSIMLSFTAMLDAERAKGFAGVLAFRFGEMIYVAEIVGGAIEVRRGSVGEGQALITAEPTQLAAVVYGGAPLDLLMIEGDEELARRFLKLFVLPPKADAG